MRTGISGAPCGPGMVRSSTRATSGRGTSAIGDSARMRRASAASSTSVPTRGKYDSRMSMMARAMGSSGIASALLAPEVRDDLFAPLADGLQAGGLRNGADLDETHDLVGGGVLHPLV